MKANFPVQITPIKVKNKKNWIQTSYAGGAKDISPKGLLLVTDAPIEKKDLVQLRFSLSSSSKSLEVHAVARFVNVDDSGKNKVGFEFDHMSPESEKYLATMMMLYKP